MAGFKDVASAEDISPNEVTHQDVMNPHSELRNSNSYYIAENGDVCKTDDNGKTYMVNDSLIPNCKYCNEGAEYKTDEQGTSFETGGNDNLTNDVENKTWNLTDEKRQEIKDKLGWSDEKLSKCTTNEDDVIQYKTDRSDLEGKTSDNGVPYERKTIEINGVKIEGVFPEFDSAFDTELDPDNLKTKAYAKECNAKLKEAIASDPELKSKFSEEQLKDVDEGRTPTGYVWHHNEEPGIMQLVKREDHDRAIGGAAHTGGNSLWGADSLDKKGESF